MENNKKLNRGEWAEFYVLLKLLGDGKLYAANKLLQKNYQNYLDIIQIIRQETKSPIIEYNVDKNRGIVIISESETKKILTELPMDLFNKQANILMQSIKTETGMSIAVHQSVYDFAKVIYVNSPKAPAVKSLTKKFGGKSDIFIQIRDPQTSLVSLMGFSIKSKFSDPSTLFNAGTTSQFMFEMIGLNDDLMEKFNEIKDPNTNHRGWRMCKQFLTDNEIGLKFTGTKYQIYNDNLNLIRENMDSILAWCVKDRLIDSDGDTGVMETVGRLINKNPMKVSNPDVLYKKVIKDFLIAGFTGMTAGKAWDGSEDVNGGYICVLENGDVVCYHSNDRESFRDYLYRNTFFEYVSTDKYKWGFIEKNNGKYYLPLNISIRFRKNTR